MEEDHYSLTESLQLTQKKLRRVSGNLKENNVLIRRVRKAAKARKHVGGGQRRGSGEGTKRERYDVSVQECFYSIAQGATDWVLDYAKLKTSEPCSDRRSVARS